MSSLTPPTKNTGTETTKEGRERLQAMSKEARAGEKASIAVWNGTQCKAKLDAMGIDFTGVKDTGVLRMMVSHELQLGVMPANTWTPRAIKFAVREMFSMTASDQ